jgi:glycosyltransferase involved in cell wall biosynthesis
MRILNVNNTLNPLTGGGTAERTFQMSRALARAGIPCTVLTTDVSLGDDRTRELKGTQIVTCPAVWPRFFVPEFSVHKIRRAVAQADVIHLMGHWSVLNAFVYLIATRLRRPYVVCPAGALPIYGRSRLLKGMYNRVVGRRLIRDARFCIAVTPAEIPAFESYGVERRKIRVIPNGIQVDDVPVPDPQAFRARHALGAAPIILFVGRLNQIKGPDLLLQAFMNLGDAVHGHQLVFVGPDGGMLEALREMAVRRDMGDRVRFLGFLGGAEKYQAYFASSMLVVPSRQEAMSIVVLEAGVTATPVLLTDQCGFDEVAQRRGGEVVHASVADLERGLLRLLSNPPALKQMGAALKTLVEERYAWDSLLPTYLSLYRECLS